MRKRLLVANWKLNGNRFFIKNYLQNLSELSLDLPKDLPKNLPKQPQIVICPPSIYLDFFSQTAKNYKIKYSLGAQNCAEYQSGAYTGEISAKMISESGCEFVIVGHSERRTYFLESNTVILQKIKSVQEAGLTPVICIGETQAQKQANQTQAVLESQLEILRHLAWDTNQTCPFVIAYEPIWAIGTGLVPEILELSSIFSELRNVLKIRYHVPDITLLYGGSLTAQNAQSIFEISDIDGGLVGGASLKPKDFMSLAAHLFLNQTD